MKQKDCTCDECVAACKSQPGWFAHGEAEKAAEYLGVPFDEFKAKWLVLDSCDNWRISDAPYVWAPRKIFVDRIGDTHRSYEQQSTHGRCVFLTKENRCSIHAVKPFECRQAMGCGPSNNRRFDVEKTYMNQNYPLGLRPSYSTPPSREEVNL